MNKNIRELYSDTIEFNRGYQPRTNLVKDETGDLLPHTHSIFNRRGGTIVLCYCMYLELVMFGRLTAYSKATSA